MKAAALSLWVLCVALAATWAGAVYLPAHTLAQAAAHPSNLQVEKTRVLNVPVVADGAVQGFIAMQFEFTQDTSLLKNTQVPAQIFLLDEAFRGVYADESLDFHNLKKFDIGGLATRLVASTNERLGAPVIKDVLIVDFSYVPKAPGKTEH